MTGWGEALEAEWESLSNRLNLVNEETRQLKMHIRTAQVSLRVLSEQFGGRYNLLYHVFRSPRHGVVDLHSSTDGMAWKLTRMTCFFCQDDIAKLQMERDDYEMDMERFQMREV